MNDFTNKLAEGMGKQLVNNLYDDIKKILFSSFAKESLKKISNNIKKFRDIFIERIKNKEEVDIQPLLERFSGCPNKEQFLRSALKNAAMTDSREKHMIISDIILSQLSTNRFEDSLDPACELIINNILKFLNTEHIKLLALMVAITINPSEDKINRERLLGLLEDRLTPMIPHIPNESASLLLSHLYSLGCAIVTPPIPSLPKTLSVEDILLTEHDLKNTVWYSKIKCFYDSSGIDRSLLTPAGAVIGELARIILIETDSIS
ncbi:MAG: hypothetical protein OXB84_04235 [Halobacteriovoraceae bacterium]|nr:hypothetical protein [Halobacteriovoraceae bacterium]